MSDSKAAISFPVAPKCVRYIKLGEGGCWEPECIEKGIVRFGFGTSGAERYAACTEGRWPDLTKSFVAEGRSGGTATRYTNETRLFFEDEGSTLWITFVGERLFWGVLEPGSPEFHPDGDGVIRRVAGGWRSTDVNGEPLTKDRLSGALTKLAGYRGTSCSVDVADYVVRRVNGQKSPAVERAEAALDDAKRSAIDLMQFLGPRDFETLVDLIFSTSGWRRLGSVGGTQKTLDLDLMLPSTGEKAFVQVKCRTSSAELAEYVERLETHGAYDHMFFAFHTGEASTSDDRVKVLGPNELAALVIDAGLLKWLIWKAT